MIVDFLLVLFLGTGVAWLSGRLRLPAAVGQVLLGLVIGPPLLGWIASNSGLQTLSDLGVVLLLGMAGLHLGLGRLARAGWTGLWVALLGILLSLIAGYGFAAWWGSPHAEALYVGTALTATSIGISVQVLHQFGLINRKTGQVVIAAAVIDDVVALYLLTVALAGKILGGVLGAAGTGGLTTRLLIGVSMAPRGEVVLVIATLGFQQGHVSHHVLVALILMTIGAAVIAPALIVPLARRQQRASE